jgi:hypothetical protein
MRIVFGRDRQAATGPLIVNIIYLFDFFLVKKYFPDIPGQDACRSVAEVVLKGAARPGGYVWY